MTTRERKAEDGIGEYKDGWDKCKFCDCGWIKE